MSKFEFPAFIKLEAKNSDDAKGKFLRAVDETMKAGETRTAGFAATAQRDIDRALSVPTSARATFTAEIDRAMNDASQRIDVIGKSVRRNLEAALSGKVAAGGIDIDVAGARQAAAIAEQRAAVARQLAQATQAAAIAEKDSTQATRLSIAAAKELAASETQAAAAARAQADMAERLQGALNRTGAAMKGLGAVNDNVTRATGAQRQGLQQLGFQLGDVATMYSLGSKPAQIFASQIGQITQAVQLMSGGTSRLAAFLGGPWGIALSTGAIVLAPLVGKLFESKNAAEQSAKALEQVTFATGAVTNAQSILGNVMDLATGKVTTQTAALMALARAQLAVAQIESRERMAKAGEQIQEFTGKYGPNYNAAAAKGLLQQDRPLSRLQEDLRTGKKSADEVVKSLQGMVATGQLGQGMFIDLAKAYANFGVEAENQKIFADAQKLLDGTGGKNLLKPKTARADKSAERAARAAQRLGEFGEDASKKIANIRDSFRDIPPEVERVNKASRELDDIISDLMNRKPEGFADMVEQAKELKKALPDEAFQRTLREITQGAEQQVAVQALMLQGRKGEADALQQIYQIERNLGPLRSDQKAEIVATAVAMQRVNEAMQTASEIQAAFLDATRVVRSEVEAILGGYGNFKSLGASLKRSFQQVQGKVLFEQLFGDAFREIDQIVKQKTGVASGVDTMATETARAGSAASTLADELLSAARRISGMGIGTGSAGAVAGASAATIWGNLKVPDAIRRPGYDLDPNGPIWAVAAKKGTSGKTVSEMTPQEYAAMLAQKAASPVVQAISDLLGPKFAKALGPSIGGALEGWMTTGTGFGAVLGGLKELKGLPQGLSKDLRNAFGGAQIGAQVAGIGNALGLKMSDTGAQIGAAIGSVLPIPGGPIAGALLGGFARKLGSMGFLGPLGVLLTRTKKGYAIASNGAVTKGGNRTQADNAGQGANSLNDTLSNISRAFGGSLGNYAVSIGSRSSGYIRVSASGSSRVADKSFAKNGGSDLLYDGKDMAEALRIALKNAIEDGAIQGIRAGSKRLLSIGSNIDAQVEKALKFESVFKSLKAIKDPVGAALDELNTEFKGLIDIFKEAGASSQDMVQLEELYGLQRVEAIKRANEQIISGLKSLVEDLTIGDNGLSLRDRKAAALDLYNPLRARVQAGDTTAYDDYANAARSLLDIERQLSGSTGEYFALLKDVTTLSQGMVDRQTEINNASAASDSPFTSGSGASQVSSAIDNQTQALLGALGAINDNLVTSLRSQIAAATASGSAAYVIPARGYF